MPISICKSFVLGTNVWTNSWPGKCAGRREMQAENSPVMRRGVSVLALFFFDAWKIRH